MIKMLKYITCIQATLFAIQVFAKVPEVRTEVREIDGKKVTYMFINGIMVHETDPTKEPFPPVVKPEAYDADFSKAPQGAEILFDGSQKSMSNWTSMNGKATKWKFEDGALVAAPRAGYI